jgi:hypothetical protein
MQKRRISVGLVVLLAAVVFVAPASAAPRFHGDVAGSVTGPGHSFVVGDGINLRFRDRRRANTPYRVCWSRKGRTRCWHRTTGQRGHFSQIFTPAPSHVGTFRVRWRVHGKIVASWSFYNGLGD